MNDLNETAGLLRVDELIDQVAASRPGDGGVPRSAGAPLSADEALVAGLSGLTVIDWPPDEAGDRIARSVAQLAARAEPEAPAGHRHPGRRRPAHRRGWAAAGLVAAAAALVLVAVQFGPSDAGSPGQTLAYRTVAAVNGASQADILYSRTIYANGTAGGTGALDEWDYGISVREELFDEKGSITDDVSAVVSHGMRDRRFVYYGSKTWTEDSVPAGRYGRPGGVAAMVSSFLGAGRIGTTRSGGMTSVITLADVNGTQMYKVTDTWSETPDAGQIYPLPLFTDSQEIPAATIGRVLGETVWINAATHLPVQVTLNASDGRVIASQTFSWLTPDQANLAELVPAPVPAGFHQAQPAAH